MAEVSEGVLRGVYCSTCCSVPPRPSETLKNPVTVRKRNPVGGGRSRIMGNIIIRKYGDNPRLVLMILSPIILSLFSFARLTQYVNTCIIGQTSCFHKPLF